MRWQRLLWQLWPWRWARTLRALWRGVRLHPSTVLLGCSSRFELGHGCVTGAGVRVDTGNSGRLTAGERVWLAAGTEIETLTAVSIGAGTTVQRRASINGSVRIGRGCILAPNVFVSSGTHPFRHAPHLPIREQERMLAATPGAQAALDRPVWIQDDCWLGVNAVVCPGVTIGKGSIVGATAVVTRDVAPYLVVGGAPARTIGTRLEWRPPARIDCEREGDLIYVLSGSKVRCGDNGRYAIAVSRLEPLLAVVSATSSTAKLHCWASAPINARAGGASITLERGYSIIEIQVLPATHAQQGALVELTPCDDPSSAVLRIFQIASV